MIVVDVRKTMTAEAADYFIQVQPNKDYEILDAMRCLVADQELDVDKVGGVPVDYLKEVADAMVNCNFGVIFFGLGLTQSAGRFRNIEIAIALTRDLNRKNQIRHLTYAWALQRYRRKRGFRLDNRLPVRT